MFTLTSKIPVEAASSDVLKVVKADYGIFLVRDGFNPEQGRTQINNNSIVNRQVGAVRILFNNSIRSNADNAAEFNKQIRVYKKSKDINEKEKLIYTKCYIANNNNEGSLVIEFPKSLNTNGDKYHIIVGKNALRGKSESRLKLAQDYELSFQMIDKQTPICLSIKPEPGGTIIGSRIVFKFNENIFANIEASPYPSGNQKIWCCELDSQGKQTNKYIPLWINSRNNELYIALVKEMPNVVCEVPSAAELNNRTYRLFIAGGTIGDKGYSQGNNQNHDFTMDFNTLGLDGAPYMERNTEGLSVTNIRKKANEDGTVCVLMDIYNIPARSALGQGSNSVGALAALTVLKRDNTKYSEMPIPIPGRKISSELLSGLYDSAVIAWHSWGDPFPFGKDSRDAFIAKKTTIVINAPADGIIRISKSNDEAQLLNIVELVSTFFDLLPKSMDAIKQTENYIAKEDAELYKSLVEAINEELLKPPLKNPDTYLNVYELAKFMLRQEDYQGYVNLAISISLQGVDEFITNPSLKQTLLNKMSPWLIKNFGLKSIKDANKLATKACVIAIVGEAVYAAGDTVSLTYDQTYWLSRSIDDPSCGTLSIQVSEIPMIP